MLPASWVSGSAGQGPGCVGSDLVWAASGAQEGQDSGVCTFFPSRIPVFLVAIGT